MLYILAEYERNGYHDSDFYAICYNTETCKIETIEVGSTRYAGGRGTGDMLAPTLEIIETARQVHEDNLFGMLTHFDKAATLEPDDVAVGDRVRLTTAHKNMLKVQEPCRKCNGSGHWQNPRNEKDLRACFTCNGAGSLKSREKVKDAAGKCQYDRFEAGLSGVVLDCNAYGTFYDNGYNKRGRHNRTVKFRTDAGKMVTAPLAKLQMDRDLTLPSVLRAEAKKLSFQYGFGQGPGFTWYSTCQAKDVLKAADKLPSMFM